MVHLSGAVGTGNVWGEPAPAGEVLFGRIGGQVLSGIVIIAVLGSLAAVVMSAPRAYFAMAAMAYLFRRRQLFTRALRHQHARLGQAVPASVWCCWAR